MEAQSLPPARREAVRLARKSAGGAMAWLFLVVGIVWLVFAVVLTVDEVSFSASARTVQGQVVDVESSIERSQTDSSATSREVVMHRRVIEYRVDGHVHRFTERSSTSREQTVGEAVTVRYSPDDPSRASVDDWGERWLPSLMVGAALLWLALWSGVLVALRRDRKRRLHRAMTGIELTATAGALTKSRWRNVDGEEQTSWKVEFEGVHPTTLEQLRFTKTYGSWFRPRRVPAVGSTVTVFIDPEDSQRYILVDKVKV